MENAARMWCLLQAQQIMCGLALAAQHVVAWKDIQQSADIYLRSWLTTVEPFYLVKRPQLVLHKMVLRVGVPLLQHREHTALGLPSL